MTIRRNSSDGQCLVVKDSSLSTRRLMSFTNYIDDSINCYYDNNNACTILIFMISRCLAIICLCIIKLIIFISNDNNANKIDNNTLERNLTSHFNYKLTEDTCGFKISHSERREGRLFCGFPSVATVSESTIAK